MYKNTIKDTECQWCTQAILNAGLIAAEMGAEAPDLDPSIGSLVSLTNPTGVLCMLFGAMTAADPGLTIADCLVKIKDFTGEEMLSCVAHGLSAYFGRDNVSENVYSELVERACEDNPLEVVAQSSLTELLHLEGDLDGIF